MSIAESCGKQEQILNQLQDRLLEALDDHFADAERLNDLAAATSYAAEGLRDLAVAQGQAEYL